MDLNIAPHLGAHEAPQAALSGAAFQFFAGVFASVGAVSVLLWAASAVLRKHSSWLAAFRLQRLGRGKRGKPHLPIVVADAVAYDSRCVTGSRRTAARAGGLARLLATVLPRRAFHALSQHLNLPYCAAYGFDRGDDDGVDGGMEEDEGVVAGVGGGAHRPRFVASTVSGRQLAISVRTAAVAPTLSPQKEQQGQSQWAQPTAGSVQGGCSGGGGGGVQGGEEGGLQLLQGNPGGPLEMTPLPQPPLQHTAGEQCVHPADHILPQQQVLHAQRAPALHHRGPSGGGAGASRSATPKAHAAALHPFQQQQQQRPAHASRRGSLETLVREPASHGAAPGVPGQGEGGPGAPAAPAGVTCTAAAAAAATPAAAARSSGSGGGSSVSSSLPPLPVSRPSGAAGAAAAGGSGPAAAGPAAPSTAQVHGWMHAGVEDPVASGLWMSNASSGGTPGGGGSPADGAAMVVIVGSRPTGQFGSTDAAQEKASVKGVEWGAGGAAGAVAEATAAIAAAAASVFGGISGSKRNSHAGSDVAGTGGSSSGGVAAQGQGGQTSGGGGSTTSRVSHDPAAAWYSRRMPPPAEPKVHVA